MLKADLDKFAQESDNTTFEKKNQGGLSPFWLLVFSGTMIGGLAMLLYVIYQCGMDKAHPFEEMGETRIYRESLVTDRDQTQYSQNKAGSAKGQEFNV